MTPDRAAGMAKAMTRILATVLHVRHARGKDAGWKGIHKIADDNEPALTRAVLAAFKVGKNAIDLDWLKRAVKDRSYFGVESVLSPAITAFEKNLTPSMTNVLLTTVRESGDLAAKHLKKMLLAAADADIKGFAFDKTNPSARDWAEEHAAETINGISKKTRDAIRELVTDAFDSQFDVDELTAEIADVIGDQARAEKIARTEVMRASNVGQQEAWDQAKEAGLLTGDEQQEWITTPDDRLCPICEPMDGQTVPLGGMFDLDGEQVDGPPAHPNCRCTIGLTA